MTEQTPDGGFEGTESETEEEASRPQAPERPHDDDGDGGALLSPRDAGGQRPEEFNPDDFE